MIYHCPYAERRHGTILLFCAKRNADCMNQRFCRQRGETVLTQYAKDCPARQSAAEKEAQIIFVTPERANAPTPTEEKPKKKSTANKKKTDEE